MSSRTLTKRFKTDVEKKQFAADWAAAAPSRKVLAEAIQEKINFVRRKRLEKENYTNPNYAVEQAALNEQERVYTEILKLLDVNS